jgi:hypothetical protein
MPCATSPCSRQVSEPSKDGLLGWRQNPYLDSDLASFEELCVSGDQWGLQRLSKHDVRRVV